MVDWDVRDVESSGEGYHTTFAYRRLLLVLCVKGWRML
jgi:hypothetical protein